MENAKKFFEETLKTEEAKALLSNVSKPETEKEVIATYVAVASKLGVELSAEEVAEYIKSISSANAEVDDEELSQLVGGGENSSCKYTYIQSENCWRGDACDIIVVISYKDYHCRTTNDID